MTFSLTSFPWLLQLWKQIRKSTGYGITAAGVSRMSQTGRSAMGYRLWNGDRRIGTKNYLWWRGCLTQMQGTVSHLTAASAHVWHQPFLVLAWNYRRYVLANMPTRRPETSELAYTSRKIGANFSNFSAWHQRSKTLVGLWESGQLDPIQSRDDGMCLFINIRLTLSSFSLTEFELVSNALYTDPDDQSAWIYHRWLIGSGSTTGCFTCNAT